MKSIYSTVTAHNPLARIDTTLKVLKGYESIELEKEIDIFIDFDHRLDLDEFSLIVASHTDFNRIGFVVAGEEYKGYDLCWAHKPSLIRRIRKKTHDFYMYSENDMLFTKKHFDYWYKHKDELKAHNLEPGFCRFERLGSKLIPFDNYRKWKLGGVTECVWGDIPFKSEFIPINLTGNASKINSFSISTASIIIDFILSVESLLTRWLLYSKQAKSQCNPSSLEINSLEKLNPGINPLFFNQKIEQNEPEKKIPSTAAKAINLSA